MSSPEERFSAMFDRTHLALLAYAVRRVADPADAADIVAETFLVAWRRFDDVPPGDEARPWLFGVARRVLANYYRGERRRNALADRLRDELHGADWAAAPSAILPVEAAMDRLGEDDRELLRLLAWEELARDEIAVALGVSRAAVRVRLHRARTRLRKAIEEIQEETRRVDLKRNSTTGHVPVGWVVARPGTNEETP